jgi:hypothetical protein
VTAPATARPRVRLGRRRKALEAGTPAGVLVVTSHHRLWQRYGPDGVFAVERAAGRLVDAMSARGLTASLVYTDDSPLLGRLGILPADSGDANGVARVIREVTKQLSWSGAHVPYVLLLGDDGVVPSHRPENPAPEDGDVLTSDHPYAADPDDPLGAVRAVGRIPDAGLDFLLAGLSHAASAHRRLAAGEPLPLEPRAFGYSASIWKRAARDVFTTIGEPNGVRLSPPLSHREAPEPGRSGPRFRYFNLHGLADSPHWFGQRDPSFPADYPLFPVALRPADLSPAPGAVVLSEACFGAHVEGRATADSVALTYLSGGAGAFVGATGVAYGGLDGPLVAADLLAQRFWQAILAGVPAGEALAYAKRSLVHEALARQGYLDAEDEKAVYNFVLYGDPSLIHHVPTAWSEGTFADFGSRGAVKRAGPAAVGTLPVRPSSKVAGPEGDTVGSRALLPVERLREPGRLGPAQLEAVRSAVAKRLPEFAQGPVELSATSAPRRVLPKAAADPGAGPIVVSLRKSLATCSGEICSTTVRVTVDRAGRIRKVLVSR